MSLGFLAAVVGGWIDHALSRAVDTLMAIPTLIFALVVLSVLPPSVDRAGPGDRACSIRPACSGCRGRSPWTSRSWTSSRWPACAASGLRWIVTREVLPNTLPPLIAEFGLRFCFAFLFLSSL